MKASQRLQELFDAERCVETPSPDHVQHGWDRLAEALAQGAAPMAVSSTPVALAGWGVAKTFGLGLLVGAVTSGGIGIGVGLVDPSDPSHPSASATAVASPPVATARPDGFALREDAAAATPSGVGQRKGLAPRRSLAAPVSAAHRAPTFDAELRLVKLAKQDIDRGQPRRARAWLEEHRHRFPRGAFAAERDALQVLIECQTSDVVRRQTVARRFVDEHPNSPFRDRIVRSCGHSTPTAPGSTTRSERDGNGKTDK